MATRNQAREALEAAIKSNPAVQAEYADAYQAALGSVDDCMAEDRSEEAALELAARLEAITQDFVDHSPAVLQRACCAGCAFCCHLRVEAKPIEAILIAAHINATFPAEERDQLMIRLRKVVERLRGMSGDQHRKTRIRCALLGDDDKCSVYPVRPIECRGYNALFVEDCREAFANPGKGSEIRLDLHARVAAMSVKHGAHDGLGQFGLDRKAYELNSLVLRALETPRVAERWIRGEDVFRGCLTEDSSPNKQPERRADSKTGRNDPCPCGSGKKFKNCCLRK